MIVDIDFDAINKFDCTYGEFIQNGDELRVFVKGGAALPDGHISRKKGEGNFFEFIEGKKGRGVELFPRHYIYDPSRMVEYVEWELKGGLLRARKHSGEWVQYTSMADSLYAMHEYVGGFWLVFERVVFFRRSFDQYAPSGRLFPERRVTQEFGNRPEVSSFFREYLLEGVLDNPPASGWALWEICARAFYIDVPEKK